MNEQEVEEFLCCADCGEHKTDVIETICPYVQDTFGEEQEAVLCTDCYNDRVRNI